MSGAEKPSSVDGPFLEVAYAYDGTLEGLLTAIFQAYALHEDPTDVAPAATLQPRLGQYVRTIEADGALARRVQRGISRTCGEAAFDAVRTASLSDDPGAGTAAYRFVRHAMAAGAPHDCGRCPRRGRCGGVCSRPKRSALADIAHPAVEPLVRIARAVSNERHLMTQFVRFEHLSNGVWFARCNPKASVVPLLMDWFSARFNDQPFIVFDENHGLAGVYTGDTWYLVRTETVDLPGRAAEEELMQQAWKRFYRTVAVESRYNPELRRHFMPKRFWRNITELQEDLPAAELAATRASPRRKEPGRQVQGRQAPDGL